MSCLHTYTLNYSIPNTLQLSQHVSSDVYCSALERLRNSEWYLGDFITCNMLFLLSFDIFTVMYLIHIW